MRRRLRRRGTPSRRWPPTDDHDDHDDHDHLLLLLPNLEVTEQKVARRWKRANLGNAESASRRRLKKKRRRRRRIHSTEFSSELNLDWRSDDSVPAIANYGDDYWCEPLWWRQKWRHLRW